MTSSVLIPSFGRPALLERCLRALARQRPPPRVTSRNSIKRTSAAGCRPSITAAARAPRYVRYRTDLIGSREQPEARIRDIGACA